jgi:hypothetical protein
MQDEVDYRPARQPGADPTLERGPILESEYRQSLVALNRVGIVSILPESEKLGVIGVDGKEYPAPTWAEVQEVVESNLELIEQKQAQGFTKLQLTPLAVPISILIDRAEKAILKHSQDGKIFQTKIDPNSAEVVARVDTDEPVWAWDTVREAIKTDDIVYFPSQFGSDHKGKSKDQITKDQRICSVPGWSIGLIEDTNALPRQGSGKTVGGRKQLENNQPPHDYLKNLQTPPQYQGESGWTYEDFLTDFLVNLEQTNRVSHEWFESSALWMVGSYLPGLARVPDGGWDRGRGQLNVDADGPGHRNKRWSVRSTVRLGL